MGNWGVGTGWGFFGFRGFLGGGNSNIFYFYPDPWGDDPI